MDISAVSGVSASARPAEINSEYDLQVMLKAKDVIEEQGEQAVRLIQSATVAPGTGRSLNVQV